MTLLLQAVDGAVGAAPCPATFHPTGWGVGVPTQYYGNVYFALRGTRRYAHNFPPVKGEQDVNAETAIERSTA